MAKQIEGVYERIMECAKKEFLAKGYTDASLRMIASEAGMSTNSIYVRFQDKEGLFGAIVEPVYEEFMSCLRGKHEELIGQKGIYASFVLGRKEAIGWKLKA